MIRRSVRTLVLDIATAGVVLAAVGALVHDRLLPALAERARLDPGERIGSPLAFRPLGGGEVVDVADGEPALVVVFRSSCPVCEDTAPDWKALGGLAPHRVLAVGLESDSAAAAWVAANVPGIRAVVPLDPARFLDRLRIRAVPTTLLFEGRRLALARIGPLLPADHVRIRRAIQARAADLIRTHSPLPRRMP